MNVVMCVYVHICVGSYEHACASVCSCMMLSEDNLGCNSLDVILFFKFFALILMISFYLLVWVSLLVLGLFVFRFKNL